RDAFARGANVFDRQGRQRRHWRQSHSSIFTAIALAATCKSARSPRRSRSGRFCDMTSSPTTTATSHDDAALRDPSTRDASVRAEDVALHEDVRWLAAALGRAIKRLEG